MAEAAAAAGEAEAEGTIRAGVADAVVEGGEGGAGVVDEDVGDTMVPSRSSLLTLFRCRESPLRGPKGHISRRVVVAAAALAGEAEATIRAGVAVEAVAVEAEAAVERVGVS